VEDATTTRNAAQAHPRAKGDAIPHAAHRGTKSVTILRRLAFSPGLMFEGRLLEGKSIPPHTNLFARDDGQPKQPSSNTRAQQEQARFGRDNGQPARKAAWPAPPKGKRTDKPSHPPAPPRGQGTLGGGLTGPQQCYTSLCLSTKRVEEEKLTVAGSTWDGEGFSRLTPSCVFRCHQYRSNDRMRPQEEAALAGTWGP
jgi:hypothetical protein